MKKKKDSKFQTWKAFFFFLINELWMWLWCDPAYWLYNTIQYNAANWDKNIVVVPTRNGWSYCKSRHHRSHGAVRREWLLIQTHCIKAKGIWKIMSWFLCNSFSYMGVIFGIFRILTNSKSKYHDPLHCFFNGCPYDKNFVSLSIDNINVNGCLLTVQ